MNLKKTNLSAYYEIQSRFYLSRPLEEFESDLSLKNMNISKITLKILKMPSDITETERILEGVAILYNINLHIEEDNIVIGFNRKTYICYGYYYHLLKDMERRLNFAFSGEIIVERQKNQQKRGFNTARRRRKSKISI